MAAYDFSTLSSSDLEDLVCDLLNANLPSDSKVRYRTFKDGKDKGIDILYSTENYQYNHVGQVKHYYRTGFSGMLQDLKKSEVSKVRKLKPQKYIFATSVDLTVANTDKIKNTFKPFIKSLEDVYGKKDLNRLIEENSNVLDNHYKLWLSDSSVIGLILNSDLEFRSTDFVKNELQRRIRLYVKTDLFEQCRTALAKNKFIIITGDPGVGKTTLAEMLTYEYLADGYKLTYIVDDIKEAEKAIVPDDSKRIIYYDDFLGSNAVEINRAKGSETILRAILRRIGKSENKLVILTTRVFLLNTAVEESENLRKFNIKAKASLFELKEYGKDLKRQLLLNHIEDSELEIDLKECLLTTKLVDFIVNHDNFSPRIVEFITSKEIANHYDSQSYNGFVTASFDYPEEIWKHAYNEQIKEDDRLMLNTLFSFGEVAPLDQLEQSFMARLQHEVLTNNKSKEIHAFTKSLRRLDGGFLFVKDGFVYFINPSLTDFLLKYLRDDQDEVLRIAASVKYVSQLTERLFSLGNANSDLMPSNIQKRLLEDYRSFIRNGNGDYDLIQLALVINKYIKDPEKDDIIAAIINEVTEWEALHEDYTLNNHFKEFIISVADNYYLSAVLQDRLEEIVSELFYGKDDIVEAIELLEELTKKFDLNFAKLNTTNITDRLDSLFSEHIDQEVDWLRDYIYDEGEAIEKESEIRKLQDRLYDIGLDYEVDLGEFNLDWYEIAMHNDFKRQMEKDD